MRKMLAIFACNIMLLAGPCTLDSWNLAINPGVGDTKTFVGVELEFGDFDFVVPIVPIRN